MVFRAMTVSLCTVSFAIIILCGWSGATDEIVDKREADSCAPILLISKFGPEYDARLRYQADRFTVTQRTDIINNDKRLPHSYENQRVRPGYAFGLGKRRLYTFGLGKRNSIDNDYNDSPVEDYNGYQPVEIYDSIAPENSMQGEMQGKRGGYDFGIGKRDKFRFGIGKRVYEKVGDEDGDEEMGYEGGPEA